MKDDHELIVLAAYGDLEAARSDFEDVERARKHSLELRAAALVTKNAEGKPEVLEASNKHGRLGAGMGAGIGLLFGLLAPPLSLSLLVGAAAGGLVASFAEHELRSGLHHEIGEALQSGTGVIIAVVYPNGREPLENTLIHATTYRELRMDRATINTLDAAVAEAMKEIDIQAEGSVNSGTTDTSS